MPLKNKTIGQVVQDELIDKSHISDRLVRIYLCSADRQPKILYKEGKVRDDKDWDNMRKAWENCVKECDEINSHLVNDLKRKKSSCFMLRMVIIERDTDGKEFNPLGSGVSIMLHKAKL